MKRAHVEVPRYGVERLAIVLNWSEGKTRRIRNLAGVEALRKRKKGYKANKDKEVSAPENLLRKYWRLKNSNNPQTGYDFSELTKPELGIWVQDFTYISWHGRFVYFAATLRLASREVVGWAFGFYHDAELVCESLEDALRKEPAPDIVHNDCGSEYLSLKHYEICKANNIRTSASDPGEPWQNGFMERFFNTFKEEMSVKIRSCKTITEVYEKIANWVYHYNYERIHTALKMSPKAYAAKLQEEGQLAKLLSDSRPKSLPPATLTKSFLASFGKIAVSVA